MKKYFSVGETAKIVNMTKETLRHYDRIGLAKPSKTDEWTKYRYYTQQDIVRLNTIHALRQMDLPLKEIKQVLDYDELEKIIDFLAYAEQKADEKIAAVEYSKSKILAAKKDYEKKLLLRNNDRGLFIKDIPQRIIMLSDSLDTPTEENLWNYLSHFYDQIEPSVREKFIFEDIAGIYTEKDLSRLFAVCVKYEYIDSLHTLPAGRYLCANCNEEKREETINKLLLTAKEEYNAKPEFIVQLIVVSGILHWNYQVQVCLEN